jgi:hypothetical protein
MVQTPKMDLDYLEDVLAGIFALGPSFKSLDIGILGAGIAGLNAAIGPSQSGHKVEVRKEEKPCPIRFTATNWSITSDI